MSSSLSTSMLSASLMSSDSTLSGKMLTIGQDVDLTGEIDINLGTHRIGLPLFLLLSKYEGQLSSVYSVDCQVYLLWAPEGKYPLNRVQILCPSHLMLSPGYILYSLPISSDTVSCALTLLA